MKLELDKNITDCPICEKNDFENILNKDRYGFKINTTSCKKCGLVMTNPLPTKEFLNDFYTNKYRKYYESTEIPNEEYFLKFVGRASKRIKYISKYLNDGINYLDIGSADGSYLWLIKQFFYINETGIEPNRKYSNFSIKSKGLNIINNIYENVEIEDNYYDIISHFHVLEHIHDINHFLQFNYNKLNKGGILYIEVPNIMGNWSGIGMIHIGHLYNFSKISLSNLLIKNGFHIEVINEYNDETFGDIIRVIAKKSDNKSEIKVENYKEIKKFVLKNINRISKIEFKIITFSKKIIGDYNTKKIIKLINSYVKRK